jgi:hypothetical protein
MIVLRNGSSSSLIGFMAELLKHLYAGIRDEEVTAVVRALLRWAAAMVILLFALILYSPALGSSRFVFGTDTVSHDYIMHMYGWVQSIGRAGELPLWNPYMFSGMPMLASAALCPFYPSQWLYAIFPFNTAFTLQYVFAMALGGIGAGWWMRCLGHRRAVCVWAGFLYMVSGHFLTLTYAGHLQKMIALGWTPIALGATIQVMRLGKTGVKHSRRYKAASLLGIALGMQLLATHPQIFYATAAACVLQLVGLSFISVPWKAILSGTATGASRPSRALQKIGRAIAMSLLALVVCGAIAAVQLFPSMEMSAFSNRADGVTFAEATETSYPPMELLEYAVPSIFGDSVKGSAVPYSGQWGERIVSDYIGIPVLLLALFGLMGNKRRYRWFLLTLLVVGTVVGLGRYTPVYWLLWEVLPGFDGFRSPGTFMFLSNCALVGLSALGLEYLLNLADSLNSRGWKSSLPEEAVAEDVAEAEYKPVPRRLAHSADETQPFDVSAIRQPSDTPPAGHDYYTGTDTPPQGTPSVEVLDYDELEGDPGLGYAYPEDAHARASSNFTWDNENTPWLGRPTVLVFIAAVAIAALAAAIIALAENWDVDLKIATDAEKLSYHTYSRVAGAAVGIMGVMAGIVFLRLRTWVGGVIIGLTALAFPLFYNHHFLQFDPLPPYMAHLTRQPDLHALAKRESRPVRLLEENALKNEDMLYGISSVAGYHPITPKAYTQTAAALGFGSDAFASLFAVNRARTSDDKGPAEGTWAVAADYPAGNGSSQIWQRTPAVPYLRENATLAALDTSDISLTSASLNAMEDAARFNRPEQYIARVSLDDARTYRMVEGIQTVQATLQKWLPHEVRLHVAAQSPRPAARALLTVSDPYFPGWHAETSRAAPLPVIAVNGVQRGVVLPPGEQNIRFIYSPYSFRLGLFISLFSATLLLFYAMGTLTRRFSKGQKKLRKALKRAQTGQHHTIDYAPGKDTTA